jgi:hypothetical protein
MTTRITNSVLSMKRSFASTAQSMTNDWKLYKVIQMAVDEQTGRPKPEFKVVWVNPQITDENGEVCTEKTKQVIKTFSNKLVLPTPPMLYHGTSAVHSQSMRRQSELNKGPIDEKGCVNGDRSAGIYGLGNREQAFTYTQAETVVHVAGVKPYFDENRGTVYFPATDPIVPVQVLRVANYAELKKFVETDFIYKTSSMYQLHQELRKDPELMERLAQVVNPQEMKELVKEKAVFKRLF